MFFYQDSRFNATKMLKKKINYRYFTTLQVSMYLDQKETPDIYCFQMFLKHPVIY